MKKYHSSYSSLTLKLHVYEEGVVVYSCVLVLANPKTGKNQFKIRQILQSDANPHSVSLWKRGGRGLFFCFRSC